MKIETCDTCAKSFTAKKNLVRHLKLHSGEKPYVCDNCQKRFARNSDLTQHMKTHTKEKNSHRCERCTLTFVRKADVLAHVRMAHPLKRKGVMPHRASKHPRTDKCAFNVFSTTLFHPIEENCMDLIQCFEELHPQIIAQLNQELNEKSALKWYAVIRMLLSRTMREGEENHITPFFRSKCATDLMPHTVEDHVEEAFEKISRSFEEFTQRGSGWTLEKILYRELCMARYNPLAASSYIPLPKKLADKKAVLNIQNNEDNKCLVWCLLAHKHPIHCNDNPYRVSHYSPYEHEIRLGNIPCLEPVTKMSTVEDMNRMCINVFGYEDGDIFPLHLSKRTDPEVVNLLYIANKDAQHYCLIKNMSRLLGHLTKHDGARYYCYRCLHRFYKPENLREHEKYCQHHSPQHICWTQVGSIQFEEQN